MFMSANIVLMMWDECLTNVTAISVQCGISSTVSPVVSMSEQCHMNVMAMWAKTSTYIPLGIVGLSGRPQCGIREARIDWRSPMRSAMSE